METHPTTIRVRIQVAILVGLMTATALSAFGQAVGPEIPIWVDSYSSHRPSVAFDIVHEEFLVVWYNVQDSNSEDVYARRVNMDGSLSTWFSVVSGAGERYFNPAIDYNQFRQEYLVVWVYDFGPGDYNVEGRLVSWNGSSMGSPITINSDVDVQDNPAVAFNPNDDEYLVAYENHWESGLRDVDAQRVNGDGSLLSWANVSTSPGVALSWATVAFSPEQDEYLIGYTSYVSGTADWGVLGKIAAPDLAGVSVAPEITIVDNSIDSAFNPAVGAHADGFIAQYNLGIDTRARRLAADGTPLGPTTGFPLGYQDSLGSMTNSRANAVARADAVGLVASWQQWMTAGGYDVYAQVVSPNDDRLLSRPFILADNPGHEREVDIACAPWGTCLVVYQHFSGSHNIVGRMIQLHIFGDGFESGNTSAW